jgi:hypothetical protein
MPTLSTKLPVLLAAGLLLLAALLPARPLQAQTPLGPQPDLRLLIDISGSMKQSDPDNLRGPALELIVRLLPEGARAGVWIFGEEVEQIVPHATVNAAWRAQALEAVARIDNSAQRTHIPAALAAATYDIGSLSAAYRTSIVLLTDGKVDIAPSPMANAAAARDLLAKTAPDLGALGIPVHTIALSDEADWTFLRALAESTAGIAEKAQTAGELTGIFVQSLEMVAPSARVPVVGNLFLIDDSVEQFTALVFHEQPDAAATLTSPSGSSLPARRQPGRGGVVWQPAVHPGHGDCAGAGRLDPERARRRPQPGVGDLEPAAGSGPAAQQPARRASDRARHSPARQRRGDYQP